MTAPAAVSRARTALGPAALPEGVAGRVRP